MERPYIHVNCASTLDGRIAYPDGSRMKISNEEDMRRVHHLRRDLGSILVGARTVLMDDPKLTVKKKFISGFNPINKIVIDGSGTILTGSRFLRTEGRSIIVTSSQCNDEWMEGLKAVIEKENLDCQFLIVVSESTHIPMDRILARLKENGIDKVLVEGGTSMISQIITDKLFDRLTIYYGPLLVGGEGPSIFNMKDENENPIDLKIRSMEKLSEGILVELEMPGT